MLTQQRLYTKTQPPEQWFNLNGTLSHTGWKMGRCWSSCPKPASTSPQSSHGNSPLSAPLPPLLQRRTARLGSLQQRCLEARETWTHMELPASSDSLHQWYAQSSTIPLALLCYQGVLCMSANVSLPGAAQTAYIHSLLKKQPEPEMDTPFLQSKGRENK